jgi:hypothetical protein
MMWDQSPTNSLTSGGLHQQQLTKEDTRYEHKTVYSI